MSHACCAACLFGTGKSSLAAHGRVMARITVAGDRPARTAGLSLLLRRPRTVPGSYQSERR